MPTLSRLPVAFRWSRAASALALVLALLGALTPTPLAQSGGAGEHWVGTWTTAAIARAPLPAPGGGRGQAPQGQPAGPPPPPPLNFDGQTLRQIIRTDEIYVADMPGIEFVIDGVDPRALILLDDISPHSLSPSSMPPGPLSSSSSLRSTSMLQTPTARLFVYQRNLERLAGALESVENELRSALERELAGVIEEHDLGESGPNDAKLLN